MRWAGCAPRPGYGTARWSATACAAAGSPPSLRACTGGGGVIDGEVLTVAAILHDIGLYAAVSTGGVYTRDGADLARAMLPRYGWTEARIERCAEAIDRHHELRSQLARGPEVEALRRADLVDVSGGLIRFGVGRTWLRRLGGEVPRRGFARELAREVGRALRERPLTLPRIFLRS